MAVVRVTGLVRSPQFHGALRLAKALLSSFPERVEMVEEDPLLECAWNEFLSDTIKEVRGELWGARGGDVICSVDGTVLGGYQTLLQWAEGTGLHPNLPLPESNPSDLGLLAEEAYRQQLEATKHPFVFLDISIDEKPAGRFVFELFSDLCLKASENFRALCAGEGSESSPSYKGSLIHRIVPQGWIQGGDITGGRGDGGTSIYGPVFEDESFAVPHGRRGVLGMANHGRHSNNSQFYVTLQPSPWMDRQYVAFGQLVEGAQLLTSLEEVSTRYERPTLECRVTDCGPYTGRASGLSAAE